MSASPTALASPTAAAPVAPLATTPVSRAPLGAWKGPARRSDGLSPGQLRAVVVAIGLLHVAAIWGALQVPAVREAVLQAAPMFVDILPPPAPSVPPAPPPPPLQPVPKVAPPPPVLAAAPSPAPAPFEVPAPPELPPPAPEPVAVQAPPAPPAPPPPPKFLPASLVQYLDLPSPVYPLMSKRARESGTTQVLVFIDQHGLPATVQVKVSSGSVRLDDAALAAVKKVRFKPPTENGQPLAGWAVVPITFELE